MKRKHRDFAFSTKEIGDKGEFSGYLSVYHVIDAYKEQVLPGAFEVSLKEWEQKGKLPPILWQHNTREPIGPFTKMLEDTKGLYVEGMLLIKEIVRAAEARALMIANVISGMSIGFDTVVDEFNKQTGILSLKQIDLWEGSIVTFPANQAAQVEAVKSLLGDGKMPSLKEFEEVLRDVGFSHKQAKTIVGVGYAGLLRDVEGRKTQPVDVKSLVDDVFRQPINVLELIS